MHLLTGKTIEPRDGKMDTAKTETFKAEAFKLGKEQAENAAAWSVDGNADPDERRRVLAMLRDGDGQAFDFLPNEPNLSGEFADGMTPARLVEAVCDNDPHFEDIADETLDAICDAYENGVSETFSAACEAELIKHYAE